MIDFDFTREEALERIGRVVEQDFQSGTILWASNQDKAITRRICNMYSEGGDVVYMEGVRYVVGELCLNLYDSVVRNEVDRGSEVKIESFLGEEGFLIGFEQDRRFNPFLIDKEECFNTGGGGFRTFRKAKQRVFYDNPCDARVTYVFDEGLILVDRARKALSA